MYTVYKRFLYSHHYYLLYFHRLHLKNPRRLLCLDLLQNFDLHRLGPKTNLRVHSNYFSASLNIGDRLQICASCKPACYICCNYRKQLLSTFNHRVSPDIYSSFRLMLDSTLAPNKLHSHPNPYAATKHYSHKLLKDQQFSLSQHVLHHSANSLPWPTQSSTSSYTLGIQ